MIKRMLSAFACIAFISSMGACIAQDLSKLSYDDRQSIELACSMAKVQGPSIYHGCLNANLQKLGNVKPVDLTSLSWDDRQSVELACSMAKVEGPATYHSCLNAQLHGLAVSQTLGTGSKTFAPTTAGTSWSSEPALATQNGTTPSCAENGSCFGDISPATDLPKTILVRGYYRSNGTYVRGYYRSK